MQTVVDRSSFINRLLYVAVEKIKKNKKRKEKKKKEKKYYRIYLFIYTMHFLFFLFYRMLNNDRGEKKNGRKWVREGGT